jgi:hypothetical protein
MSISKLLWRTSCVLLIFLGSLSNSAHGQTISDHDNSVVATQSADSLLDAGGQLVFTIDAQGVVHDGAGSNIGHFDAQGLAYDLNGDQIGDVDGNGHVHDMNSDLLGKINGNNTVTDINDDLLANYSNMAQNYVAWFLFFNNSGIDF